ncbi:conserved exported hypothetical protein [uncultured Mycobacterium sp.]|uniref:Secreted protein n=1 Tax=uncultured Mycobacterium sp. TaxID=171292 RepID=A0A1Y5PGY0_9MYCO|nr:conserved exported hypothetical protein [uncultured Mycobacterium sp.]
MPWRSGLLVALGLGAALLSGAGIAHADSSGAGSSPGTGSSPNRSSSSAHSVSHPRPATTRTAKKRTLPTPSDPTPAPAEVAGLVLARRETYTAVARPAPRPPVQPAPTAPDPVTAVIRWFSELHDYLTGAPEAQPTPGDAISTPYGDIGKWMLGRTGKLADWPSPAYPFKTLYQPINVIIVDSTSTTAAESAQKLNAALTAAGFPPQQVHSTGYQGVIDGVAYGQQPTGSQEAFSNAHWLLINDHGRVFGPAPDPGGTGFVWTASFSREQPGLSNLNPTHIYVSFGKARDRVRDGLVAGGATSLGEVDLANKLVGRSVTTGDHDGYAVVISLN